MRDALRRRRPDLWTSGQWTLLHENAIPHTALSVSRILTKHNITVLIIYIIIWIGVQFRALPPGSTAARVTYCTILRFLNVPTLAARCLSRPQSAVVP